MDGTITKRYRFRPKRYGWGFVPVTREGRLFTLFLLFLILLSGRRNGFFEPTGLEPSMGHAASYIFDLFLIIFSTMWFMDKQTDGKLKWRRGNDDK